MKEKPISLTAAQVRAVLDGRLTQTRQVVDGLNPGHDVVSSAGPDGYRFDSRNSRTEETDYIRCPYGKPGDRLWVREAWRTSVCVDDTPGGVLETPGNGYGWPLWYEADGEPGPPTRNGRFVDGGPGFTKPGRYRSSIHMPRWASRITLEITEVRAQRLQEISERDAAASGIEPPYSFDPMLCQGPLASMKFMTFWESGHGPGSWDLNPWVWVRSVKRIATSPQERREESKPVGKVRIFNCGGYQPPEERQ